MRKPIYIFSSGKLKREGNTLVLESENGKKFIPITTVSELYCLGEVTVTKKLLEFLSAHGIPIHFFNYYGFYVGTYYPRTVRNSGFVIIKQVENYLDKEKRLKLAKKFVEGSLYNMRQNLRYYARRGKEVEEYLEKLNEFYEKVRHAKSVEELRGIEGNAKKKYYESFNEIIETDDFKFDKRTRRPPKSRIDSLLSYLNTLLYLNVLREIYMTHLDPRIGYLHEASYRSFSLNLDVAEVFKPVIVDKITLSLINKKKLKESYFMKELDGIFLNEAGRRIVTEEFENRMQSTIKSKESGKKISYRRLIRIELYKIEKHIIGDSEYTPFRHPG